MQKGGRNQKNAAGRERISRSFDKGFSNAVAIKNQFPVAVAVIVTVMNFLVLIIRIWMFPVSIISEKVGFVYFFVAIEHFFCNKICVMINLS